MAYAASSLGQHATMKMQIARIIAVALRASSHQRQTDEWLARRTEQLHLLGFSLIGPLQGKPQSRASIAPRS